MPHRWTPPSGTRQRSRVFSGWWRPIPGGDSGRAIAGYALTATSGITHGCTACIAPSVCTLPRRIRRRVPPRVRQTLVAPNCLNEIWALDVMHDALYSGRRFRTLKVLDEGHREGLAIEVGTSMPAPRVVRVLDQLVALYGCPQALRLDNGPELTAQVFVDWCDRHGLARLYIQPGKPVQNACIERFNRTFREEVLDAVLWVCTQDVQQQSDAWLITYNEHRPHDALGRVPPLTYLPWRASHRARSPIMRGPLDGEAFAGDEAPAGNFQHIAAYKASI